MSSALHSTSLGFPGFWRLYRAVVSVPAHMAPLDRNHDRVVFFEVSGTIQPEQQLERILATTWCVSTAGWSEDGCIYNLSNARERLQGGDSFADDDAGALRLFDIGCGGDGPDAVGDDRVHYARAANVDLFVTPRVAEQLHTALTEIERLYAAEPGRRAALASTGGAQ